MSVSKEKKNLRETVDILLLNENFQRKLMLNEDISAEDMLGLMTRGAISENVFFAVSFCQELIQEEKNSDGSSHKRWKQPIEAFIKNINLLDNQFDSETVYHMLETNPNHKALPGDRYIRQIKFKLEDQIEGFVKYVFSNGVNNPHNVHPTSITNNLNEYMKINNPCLFELVARGACVPNTIEDARAFLLSKEILHTLKKHGGTKAVKVYVDCLTEFNAFSNTELQMFQLE